VKEGRKRAPDPATQGSIYFPAFGSLEPEIYVRSRPSNLPAGLPPEDVLFQVLALVFHEDAHHVRVRKRAYRQRPGEDFAFEFHGHGVEFLWRARWGDLHDLRRLTLENPLGYGLAYRDDFEELY
jgi:hypothetical protein